MLNLRRFKSPDLQTHLREFCASRARLEGEQPTSATAFFARLQHFFPSKERRGIVFITDRGVRFWSSSYGLRGTLAGGILLSNVDLAHCAKETVIVQGLESKTIDDVRWCDWGRGQVGIWKLRVEKGQDGAMESFLKSLPTLRDQSCASCSVPSILGRCRLCRILLCENCLEHATDPESGRDVPVCPPCRGRTIPTSGLVRRPIAMARQAIEDAAEQIDRRVGERIQEVSDLVDRKVEDIDRLIKLRADQVDKTTSRTLRRAIAIVALYLTLAIALAGVAFLADQTLQTEGLTLFRGARIGLLCLGLPLIGMGVFLSIRDYIRSSKEQHESMRQPWVVGIFHYLAQRIGPFWLIVVVVLLLAWVGLTVFLFLK